MTDQMDTDQTNPPMEESFEPRRKEFSTQPNIGYFNTNQVNKEALEKSGYNHLLKPQTWAGLEPKSHLAIVGFTNAGKTHFLKQLLADQKIPPFDMYITLGNLPKSEELHIGYAANNYLFNKSLSTIESYQFTMDKYRQALQFAQNPEYKDKSKLFFFNDALIQSSDLTKQLGNFINQAKNFNITCVVEIHDFFANNVKMIRSACNTSIFLKLSQYEIARALNVPIDDPIIKAYMLKEDKDRAIISVKSPAGYFNKEYVAFI